MAGKPGSFDEMHPDAPSGGGAFVVPPGTNPYAGYVYYNNKNGKTPKGNSIDLVSNLPMRWRNNAQSSPRDAKQLNKLFKYVSEATGQQINSFDEAVKVWQKAVAKAEASWTGTRGGKKGKPTTPWDELLIAKRDRQAGIANDLSVGPEGGRGGTQRSVVKSIDEISDGTAWTFIDTAARQMLGRAATESEVRRFVSKAHDIAARNPNISTVTTVDDGAGGGSQKTKTKQGAGQGDYELEARNNMAASPEAGAFQAATTYFKALQDALGSQAGLRANF
jgi:hypothetical protein